MPAAGSLSSLLLRRPLPLLLAVLLAITALASAGLFGASKAQQPEPTPEPTPVQSNDYDYIVIGAGGCGAVIASRLAGTSSLCMRCSAASPCTHASTRLTHA